MKQITILATCHDSIEQDTFCFFNTIAKKLKKLNGHLILTGQEPLKIIKQKNKSKKIYFRYLQIFNHYDDQVNFINDKDLKNIIGINKSDLSKYNLYLNNIDKDILIDAQWENRNAELGSTIVGKSILEFRFEKFLKIIKPSVCLIWSSNIFPQSITLKKTCESLNIPSLSLENGWLDGTMIIDNVGIGSNNQLNLSQFKKSFLKNSDENYQAFIKFFNERKPKKKLDINNKLFSEAVINKKSIVTCLLPLQSTTYNQIGDNRKIDPIIKELKDMLTKVSKLMDVEVFFKLHPFDYIFYKKYFLKRQLLDNSEDINSVIFHSRVIISADSKTTYLSMMYNKQVFLYKKGFTSNLFPEILYEKIEDLGSEILLFFKTGMKRKTSYKKGLSFLLNEYLYKKNPSYSFGKSMDSFVRSISSNFRHNSYAYLSLKKNLDFFFTSTVSKFELKEICRNTILLRDLNDFNNLRKLKKLDQENNKLDQENNKLDQENKKLDQENKKLDQENKKLDQENKKLEASLVKIKRNILVKIIDKLKKFFTND